MNSYKKLIMNSYKKMDDGNIGILCAHKQQPGDTITVTTRDGQQRQETLGAVIGRWKHYPIYAIAHTADDASKIEHDASARVVAGQRKLNLGRVLQPGQPTPVFGEYGRVLQPGEPTPWWRER